MTAPNLSVNTRLFFTMLILSAASAISIAAIEEIDLPKNTSRPAQDCERAIKRGDIAFIGVYGFAFTLPAVDGVYRYDRFSKDIGLKVIRGTSDAGERMFNDRAHHYADGYNRVLLKYLEENHPDWLGVRDTLTH